MYIKENWSKFNWWIPIDKLNECKFVKLYKAEIDETIFLTPKFENTKFPSLNFMYNSPKKRKNI